MRGDGGRSCTTVPETYSVSTVRCPGRGGGPGARVPFSIHFGKNHRSLIALLDKV